MTPEERKAVAAVLVEAIWQRWDAALDDWDLEGSRANAQAKALAAEVVGDLIAAGVIAIEETP